MKRILKKLLVALISLFILLSLIPYLITVPSSDAEYMDKAFPESEYIEINDISVHYRVWTPETSFIKGKVLLVHGLGGSTFSWRNNIAPLQKEGYLVVAADLPGFGYSDRKSGIDHSQRARSDILWQLLDQTDPTLDQDAASSGWVLAGHSMGAGTVSAMAINKPGRSPRYHRDNLRKAN